MATPDLAMAGKREAHSVGFNLGVIALFATLLGLAVAYLISGAERGHAAAAGQSPQLVIRTLGGTTATLIDALESTARETEPSRKRCINRR